MLDKSFHFVCFPKKKIGVCLFLTIFLPSFFKKLIFFFAKIAIYWWETDKLKNFSKKKKSLNILDAFSSTGCTQSSKFERVMIVQTHAHDAGNGGFSVFFFPQKQ